MTGKEAVVTDLSSLEKALEELEGSFNGEVARPELRDLGIRSRRISP